MQRLAREVLLDEANKAQIGAKIANLANLLLNLSQFVNSAANANSDFFLSGLQAQLPPDQRTIRSGVNHGELPNNYNFIKSISIYKIHN